MGEWDERPERLPRRGPGWQILRYTNSRGASRLHVVRYDLEDAELVEQFKWHVRPDHQTFYAAASVPARFQQLYGEFVYMHQMVLRDGEGRVAHLNGDGLDNRRANLARLTQAQILAKRRPEKNGASKYKGVAWDKQRGMWRVQFRGRKVGRFEDEQEAARAFDDAAHAHWGPLAYLNFPERYRLDPVDDAAPSRDQATSAAPPDLSA